MDLDGIKRLESHSNMKAILAIILYHVFVGTNIGHLQSFRREFLYSSDTLWLQSRNSSTFAFFSLKSKMQILASGAPQKGNFGYGLFLQHQLTLDRAAGHDNNRIFSGSLEEKRKVVSF